MKNTQKLKQLASKRDALIVPGAANGLFARVVADLGYEAVYVTGAGVANMQYGLPDIGLTTLTEVAQAVTAIADTVDLPLIVDADTGFGNSLNVIRTVRTLERAGASAIQLEDQVFPKRCGHFEGKAVVAASEMVQKIKAAVDARVDGDLLIIARTDAYATEGLDAAIERAKTYIEAGADVTFVEAPTDVTQLARISGELSVPQVANMVFGGRTPEPGQKALAEMGFGLVLYANASLQAALKAARDVLHSLREEGSLSAVGDRLAGFELRQQAVGKGVWDELDTRYRVPDARSSRRRH